MFSTNDDIPVVRSPGTPWITHPKGERPPLPSLFIANVRSLPNKTDELQVTLKTQKNIYYCFVTVFTETWSNATIPGEAIQLAARVIHQADRASSSGKEKGGGLCVYTSQSWGAHTPALFTYAE